MSQDNRAWRLSGEPATTCLSPFLYLACPLLEILSFGTVAMTRINGDQSKPCTHRQLDIPFVSLVSVMGENKCERVRPPHVHDPVSPLDCGVVMIARRSNLDGDLPFLLFMHRTL
jgi:hypothetical protein